VAVHVVLSFNVPAASE
jgi:hypothetical protein